MPSEGWVKLNTDGSSRGNSERSSIGVSVRNEAGDVVYVLGKEIHETTNTDVEATAILEALRICSDYSYRNVWFQTDSLL